VTELRFTALGEPAPQGSKKHVGNGRFVEASKKLKPWRAAVADAVFRVWAQDGSRVFDTPVVVYATFYIPRPKSVRRLLPSVPPDLDKLQRSLGDALSVDAGVLADDSLIVKWVAEKRYADEHEPGVVCRIIEFDDYNELVTQ